MPTGAHFFTSFTDAVQGSTIEKTFCSRMRRAMSCVYCAPKSRMTMDWFSGDWLALDWDSTDEFLKSDGSCKGEPRAWVVTGDIAYSVSGNSEPGCLDRLQHCLASYVSATRFGRSLRIGSSQSIAVCSGGL